MTELKTKKITKKFDGVTAVSNINVSFNSGEITSIIGPNGSGKSTLINLLTGVTDISSGSFFLKDKNITKMKKTMCAKLGIVRTFQSVYLFEQMSVLDNIILALTERSVFKSIFGATKTTSIEKAEIILKRLNLWQKKNDLANDLSYGQRKLLEIGRVMAMVENPNFKIKIVMFDEPFSGLFPEAIKTISSIMVEIKESGRAVVLVEHNMNIIKKLSDKVFVMDEGKNFIEGDPNMVLSNEGVVEIYLGK
jgi:branched-chain amino acid transport system ATP-binding protein